MGRMSNHTRRQVVVVGGGEEEEVTMLTRSKSAVQMMFALSRNEATQNRLPIMTRSSSSLILFSLLLIVANLQQLNCVHYDGHGHHKRVINDDLEPATNLGVPIALPMAGVGGEKPRLIPLVAAESGYSENSSVNILCTVSQGHHDTLQFDWFKDGQLISLNNNNNNNDDDTYRPQTAISSNLAPQIEKHSDHSLLRISRVQSHHSGRYTCSAKNQFGQDSSSVNLMVNGNYPLCSFSFCHSVFNCAACLDQS